MVVVLHYPWQIDMLKPGCVSLSHAMCGCTLNHLYFVPLTVFVDLFLGTRRTRAQSSKSVPTIRSSLAVPICEPPVSQGRLLLVNSAKVPRFNRVIRKKTLAILRNALYLDECSFVCHRCDKSGMSEIVFGRARISFSTTSPRPHIQISACCLSIVRVVSFTECQQVATGSVALFFDNPGYKRCVLCRTLLLHEEVEGEETL